jgi:hypothetical protein
MPSTMFTMYKIILRYWVHNFQKSLCEIEMPTTKKSIDCQKEQEIHTILSSLMPINTTVQEVQDNLIEDMLNIPAQTLEHQNNGIEEHINLVECKVNYQMDSITGTSHDAVNKGYDAVITWGKAVNEWIPGQSKVVDQPPSCGGPELVRWT